MANQIKDTSVAKKIADSIAAAKVKYPTDCVKDKVVGASFNNFPYSIIMNDVMEDGVQAQIDELAKTDTGEGYVEYLSCDDVYGLSTMRVLVEVVSK